MLRTPPSSAVPTALLTPNVKGDGDEDFIVGGRHNGPALTLWCRNRHTWRTETIGPHSIRTETGGVVKDIDGDGDSDVIFGYDRGSDEIWWWENPFPQVEGWAHRIIKEDSHNKHHDQIVGDFDVTDDHAFGLRPAEELYDVVSDRDRIHNLARDPNYQAHKQELSTTLLDQLRHYDDPRAATKGAVSFEHPPFTDPAPPPQS